MEEDNTHYYEVPIIENPRTVKYGVNPFAINAPANQRDLLKNRISEEFSLFCTHCDLPFVDSVEFEHHNNELHGKKKLLSCNQCDATFRRQDHLKRHVQSLHNNQKYCLCPVCRKDCKRQDILLKHIKRKHSTTVAVYKCRDCAFECTTLDDLEKHELTHLATDRILCPHCKATFKRRDHMLRHVKSQHMKQMVECPICRQAYKRKDHVVRHVREKHKMGLLNGKLVCSADIM
ncbi:hypothetical protein HF086_011583 [Spodoptera exigua]|uniref:C2H2-type domain-containing protein n=1 Tax=Spodoptera exigua TaxID=7107 RepID=A0A922SET3_SPOEX|nr:hypothetical protein HF086_011583 [Spodoptera exigua]